MSSKPQKVRVLITESSAPEDNHALETKVDDMSEVVSDPSKRVYHASGMQLF